TLLSDGATIFAAHSPDEVVDVFQKGQGVFGIAVGPVQAELEGEILKLFPAEMAKVSLITEAKAN
ncbi:MAG: MerR family transcriptional regulator, partial [Acidimicrobiia bacterium]|nr:MerR family transcriptional regulator [Acidimicrobiia bacterium]